MSYKILNISTLLGVSMLSAATSYKAVLSRGLEQPMRAQAVQPQQALAAQPQQVLPVREQAKRPALAVQPQQALATQPALAAALAPQASQTAATPVDILKGSYPKAWNDYSMNDMFRILNKKPNERVNPLLLKEWIHAIYACFSDFDKDSPKFKAINYARTIHTLVTYTHGYKNPEIDTLIDALLAVWSQKAPVHLFGAQNIANSLWAFAKLDKQAPDTLLQSITERNIHTFNAQDISNSLWAFAKLDKQAPDALLQAITDTNIHDFNEQDIANSLWAFAMRGQQAPDALLKSITDTNIHTFNAQDIANSLWAFAALGQLAPDALLKSITHKNIGDFNAQGIANSLWAFATWGQQAPDALLQSITDANIYKFKPQEIANSLWAFAILGQQAPDALLQSITDTNIHDFNAQDIANSLWAFATLGHTPPEVLLASFTAGKIRDFNAQNIANGLWAFTVMNVAKNPLIDALFESVSHVRLNPKEQHQVYLASQHYDLGFDVDLEPFKIEKQKVSQSEIQIFEALKNDYPNINPQYFIPEIASYADFYTEINNQRVVIFIDGPTHYDSAGQLKASDAFLNRLLEKNGYTVRRVKLTNNMENNIQAVKRIIESLKPKTQTPKKKR